MMNESLQWWYELANYEKRPPLPGDLKLDRMRTLLSILGNPHHYYRIVHVAGSKGKGSTSAMLCSVLRQAGYRTALFTSPHLTQIEERFQVNHQPIRSEELIRLAEEIRDEVARIRAFDGNPPTFFEVATAIGFLHFRRRGVDLAVIEVGLGGRLDSTNVCRPLLSMITSISFDHVKILGNTLDKIAREKAGIIKPGIPVVSGVQEDEARTAIEEVARQQGARLLTLNRDFTVESDPGCVGTQSLQRPRIRVRSAESWPSLELQLFGEHQTANAALVVTAVEQLRLKGLHLPDHAVREGLRKTVWPARLELFSLSPLVVLDCAHNVASVSALVQTLRQWQPRKNRVLVFSASSDKDIPGMLKVLAPDFDRAIMTQYESSSRAVPVEEMAKAWQMVSDKPVVPEPQVANALKRAMESVHADDLLCVTGSVFLAGELRPMLLDRFGASL
ncbi:MAG: bifunctional folylpolyglutamate synthase/dihydrofolate synthase [Gemmataceae bacterium]